MTPSHPIVFLVDVDNTLLDNDRIEQDLGDHLKRRYAADHYVLADDKLRILAAAKKFWGERVTTVFPRQGIYAHDPKVVGAFPPADVTIERNGDLLDCDLSRPLMAPRSFHSA